ncbi:hypothetical protein [Parapedobacter sp.]
MLLKYQQFSFRKSDKKPMLISMVDSRRRGNGLTDRFKGAISVYALAKTIDVPYRCIYTHPVYLTSFLIPNQYDWLPRQGELDNTVGGMRFKLMRKQRKAKRLLRVLPLTKQLRVYANNDYLEEINRVFHTEYKWGELFDELFKITEPLERNLQFHQGRIGGPYIACVFRFQALLGDFQEYHFKPLSNVEQRRLIEKNKEALRQITEKSPVPVLVTSDSSTFIGEIKELRNVYTIPGKVVHIDNSADEKEEVYMKSFVDFFMLARAQKIYSIGTKMMYRTDFPAYAAKVNDVPFERILIS